MKKCHISNNSIGQIWKFRISDGHVCRNNFKFWAKETTSNNYRLWFDWNYERQWISFCFLCILLNLALTIVTVLSTLAIFQHFQSVSFSCTNIDQCNSILLYISTMIIFDSFNNEGKETCLGRILWRIWTCLTFRIGTLLISLFNTMG